jgi:hypothetical protein
VKLLTDEAAITFSERFQGHQLAFARWQHSEQIRWTLFNNFILAQTVLVLAWSTVFASGLADIGSTWRFKIAVLVLLSLAGATVSVLWAAIASRANRYHELHFISKARESEKWLPPEYRFFEEASKLQATDRGLGVAGRSSAVQLAVPWVFFALHSVLLFASALWVIWWHVPGSLDVDRLAACLAIVAALLLGVSAFWQWWRITYDGGMLTKGWAKWVLASSVALNAVALGLVLVRWAL